MPTTQFYLVLPQQEPPQHVLDALKLVRAWQLEVMASEQRKAAIAAQAQQQVAPRARDWRDDLMGDTKPMTMPQFDAQRLVVMNYNSGITHWHYRLADDELAIAISDPAHFKGAGTLLSVGDIITMSGPDGGAMRCVRGLEQGVYLAEMA